MSWTHRVRVGQSVGAALARAEGRVLFGVLATLAVAACGDAELDPAEGVAQAEGVPSFAADTEDGVAEKALFGLGPAAFRAGQDCDETQRALVFGAEGVADLLIPRAQDFLAQTFVDFFTNGVRSTGVVTFESLFGPLSEGTWSEVYDRYSAIRSAMRTNQYSCHVNGDLVGTSASGTDFVCGGGLFAVTEETSSFVRLCPEFFSTDPATRAGKVIHETSHQGRASFTGIGTDDRSDATPNNAARIEIFANRFNCTFGVGACPRVR